MPATYYGKNGKLILFDSTRGRNLSVTGPKQVHVSNEVAGVPTDMTVNMLNPTTGTATILSVNTNRVYIGQDYKFSKFSIALSSIASADGGLMVVEYWNGTAWTAVTGLVDGTAVGANTLRQDGNVGFVIPSNWVINDVPAAGTNLFYIRFRTTTSTGTDAVAQLIEPSSGQYFEIIFSQMNLNAPEGNARPEEILRINRNQHDLNAHYVQGSDEVILERQNITFSMFLDSVVNKTALALALQCQNPAIPTWPRVGLTTKSDTSLVQGLTANAYITPPFSDPSKKAICIQAMWDDLTGSKVFREYNECYFTPGLITLNESAEAVVLNVTGYIYGSIRSDITNFGYRW